MMKESMARRERLEATIAGQPVDRIAMALWRHFPGDDQRPADLATAILQWQREYDWDFIKVSPASSFCLADWGAEDRWIGGDEGNREYTRRAIRDPEDWARLPVLDSRSGRLGEQLRCLELVHDSVGSQVPFIQTIFSPIAQARNLAGGEQMLVHMRETPDLLHIGLETITESTIRFIAAAKPLGIAGIYYAIQFASTRVMSEAEYRAFGEPYDRRVLAEVGDCWFNMGHLHGPNPMFELAASYPIQALNWHDRETPPSLAQGQKIFPGAVSGGLEHWEDLLRGDPDQIRAQVADALAQTAGQRLIVSSGCVAPVNAPFSNLRAVRQAVESAPT